MVLVLMQRMRGRDDRFIRCLELVLAPSITGSREVAEVLASVTCLRTTREPLFNTNREFGHTPASPLWLL